MAIKNIVIVGGGTAGWMAAAALSRLGQNRLVDITLVESEAIGTVGVGEATIPPFVEFNDFLGINERELLSEVQGTFKLGIQFSNWGNQGDSYFHPFGNFGYEMAGIHFHQVWQKFRNSGDLRPLAAFSPETMSAKFQKFMKTDKIGRDDIPPINYAYHLDAGRYAAFLRKYAEKRGVVRKEGKVLDVHLHEENGWVKSIKLESGKVIAGDLFIDCSGFRGLLIEQALETGYEDWAKWLPCNRAVAIPCERDGPPLPYTKATAHSAGWQWQVPLQHRNGNGHVYCDAYMEQDEATDILLANLAGKPMADPNHLRFVTGRRKKYWNKNVVAIGLAAGFMEPLESTSIHLINTGINKLVSLLSFDGISQAQQDAYNRLTHKEYERIRDFLILHYKATKRHDSEFWNYCRTMDIPDSLQEKIDLFCLNGQIFREEDELFTATSWVAVMLGQGIIPTGYNPMADTVAESATKEELAEIEKSIQFLVKNMPSHQEFLAKYCPAKAA